MGDLVNLRQIKKRNERADKAKQAETNRALFGRTKSEKKRDEFAAERTSAAVDQHLLDHGNVK